MIVLAWSLVFVCSVILLLVVEIDMPWDARQVERYGPSFAPWGSTQLEMAIASLKDACPFLPLTYVVPLLLSHPL